MMSTAASRPLRRSAPALAITQRVGIATLALLLAGCRDAGTAPAGDPTATDGTLHATINGSAWNATGDVGADYYPNGFVGDGNPVIGIGAADKSGLWGIGIEIHLRQPPEGTYTVAEGTGLFDIVSLGSLFWFADDAAEGGSGTVTVTTFTDSHIVGTFSFTAIAEPATGASGSVTVTSGAFDIRY